MHSRWFWLGLLVTVGACPPPEPPQAPIPPVSTGKVRVRVFTEPSPVRLVESSGKLVFVATDDELQRWDDTGNVLALSADHGLPGNHVTALADDPERHWVWILTDGGFGHYDTKDETYSEILAPPAALGIDYTALAKETVALAPAAEPGVWLGTQKGLVFVTEKGGWLPTPIKEPIRALHRDRANWLWVATKTGLVARKPSGDVVSVGAAQGCTVVAPRLIVDAPDDRVLVIGADAEGHERIAVGKQLAWTTFRALPEVTWDAAVRRGNGIVVMGGGRLYRIGPNAPGAVRPLARDGVRLVPLATGAPDWVIDPLDLVLPSGATTLGAAEDRLFVGTHDLGTAQYAAGDVHPRSWLRRKQMFEDASMLSVACARQQDCWIATGAHAAWHWNGERFTEGSPDQVVLAVAHDPSGPIYAVHRTANEHELRMSRIDGTMWTPVEKVALTTPGDRPEVSFVRFAASGTLWIGLRYRDGEEKRPYGIAIVELASGKVTYHRTEVGSDKSKPKMLPIPVGVIDADVRGETAWFATNEGVARLSDGHVKIWTEADGLVSELGRAITYMGDHVVVATGAGAGVWDGKAWSFPAALRFEINDVVATHNGQLWMATERGIAAWDGAKVRRVDTRRGLVENEVLEVVGDQFDRVWARGPGSLTLVSQ